jgi:hypothetical protein
MYAVDMRCPRVPVSRPIIESSAKMYNRVIRSRAEMSAEVGCGACLRGRGVGSAGAAAVCASTIAGIAAINAAPQSVRIRVRFITCTSGRVMF